MHSDYLMFLLLFLFILVWFSSFMSLGAFGFLCILVGSLRALLGLTLAFRLVFLYLVLVLGFLSGGFKKGPSSPNPPLVVFALERFRLR